MRNRKRTTQFVSQIVFFCFFLFSQCHADWSMNPIIGPRKPLESIHFNGKATHEKLCKHHEFEQWKGTCDNHGMIICRLDISASSFPALQRNQRLYIENKWEFRPSNYLTVRFEDKKDQYNHAIITICLADNALHAQEGMLHELSITMAFSARSIGGGVRLDRDTAFRYKLKDTSFRHTGRRNRPDPLYSEFAKRNYTINDGYAYMMIDDPFKYMIGDHCLYSLGDYIAFTRNNASVVIMFGAYDEKYFQLAQRLDAMLIHASVKNDSASLELKDVDIVVDESSFSPKPHPPRRKISSRISRMSREIKSFFDILHWVLFERHRS